MTQQYRITGRPRNREVEGFVNRRLVQVFEKFGNDVQRINVHLKQEHHNGEHLSYDANVDVVLNGAGTVHVQAHTPSVLTAAVRAIHKAEQAVTHTLERQRRARKERQREGGLRRLTEQLERRRATKLIAQ